MLTRLVANEKEMFISTSSVTVFLQFVRRNAVESEAKQELIDNQKHCELKPFNVSFLILYSIYCPFWWVKIFLNVDKFD